MKKFVVGAVYRLGNVELPTIVVTFAKSKQQAIKRAKKDLYKSRWCLAREDKQTVLFTEVLTPQMEAEIILNFYEAAVEETRLYFADNYPIGEYYNSDLYRAHERRLAISKFANTVIEGNFDY